MRTLLLLALVLCIPFMGNAQSIFETELNHAANAVRQQRAGFIPCRIANFKHEALLYLKEKASQQPEVCTPQWLDRQAYHLADFLTLYQRLISTTQLDAKEHEWLRNRFSEASLAHPFFYDTNEGRIHQFVNAPARQLTPFSLDTDWSAALEKVRQSLQENPPAAVEEVLMAP